MAEESVKILLVDDRAENLLALEVMLANKNYELVKASSGKEALKILLKEQDFAIILMDALMPIMDGFETATMIRQSEKLKNVPIIFLTAQLNTPDNIFKGYQAGAVDYMLKPLSAEILKAKVAVFVELYRKTKELIIQIEEKNKAERAKLVAEEAAKSKQQFLSNMSHEIRTPLNAIIGFTKVILKTDLTKKQKEYLNAIKLSGDSLIVLINDILDLAKVDAGKMTFEKIPFKLAGAMVDIFRMFEIKIWKKKLNFVREYDTHIPEILIGDPVRLKQIILNLLSNAVKFTNEGKINVSVRLLKEDEENVIIEFEVMDTGIGISENKLETIFDNFQQATSKTTRLYGGTGLGLAIVKHLVESQGGTITVKSKIDEGSSFTFILSFKKAYETEESLIAENLNISSENNSFSIESIKGESEIKNIKILVAEDKTLNQLLMKIILEQFGFEMEIAGNGKIAIEKLRNNKYDLILMDLHMPEMNGFAATEYIRNEMNSKIPIIALTADVTTMDIEKCKAAGMNDYISKPIDEKLLRNKIIKYGRISVHPKTNGKVNSVVRKTKKTDEKKFTNLNFVKQLSEDNPKMIIKMINVYLEETPQLIDKMKHSIENMDWESLAEAAHSIIPSFSTMGMNEEFSKMAKQIQEYAAKKEKPEEIKDLISKIETVCSQAYEELQQELISLEKH